jgi:hypothetical protein
MILQLIVAIKSLVAMKARTNEFSVFIVFPSMAVTVTATPKRGLTKRIMTHEA